MPGDVLITGAHGYLGGQFIQKLPGATALDADVTDRAAVQKAFDGATAAQALVHLAGANEIVCAADVARGFAVNAVGTDYVLEAAAGRGVGRVVFFSTFHVYGQVPDGATLSEKTSPMPTHPYGITKLAAEHLARASARRRGFDLAIVRLSNGIGAPAHDKISRWSLVLLDLCRQAHEQRTLTLHTSGLQQRDFISIDDVIAAVQLLLAAPQESLRDPVFNVGSGTSVRIRDLAKMIQEEYCVLYGDDIALVAPDPADPPPPAFRYDLTRIRSLGFHPTTDVRQEVRATLRFCERFRQLGDR